MPARTEPVELLNLNIPATIVEIDPDTADDLAAFFETALSEEEALESDDYPKDEHGGAA